MKPISLHNRTRRTDGTDAVVRRAASTRLRTRCGAHDSARPARAAFTLVEILVVVIILAILAMIVVPQFTSAAEETRLNSMKMDLFRIRQQIEIYKQQHGKPPSLDNFAAQMTQPSNRAGDTTTGESNGDYPYGPYLRNIPKNPFTESNDVGDGSAGTSDWYYNEDTGEFKANDSSAHREY